MMGEVESGSGIYFATVVVGTCCGWVGEMRVRRRLWREKCNWNMSGSPKTQGISGMCSSMQVFA